MHAGIAEAEDDNRRLRERVLLAERAQDEAMDEVQSAREARHGDVARMRSLVEQARGSW